MKYLLLVGLSLVMAACSPAEISTANQSLAITPKPTATQTPMSLSPTIAPPTTTPHKTATTLDLFEVCSPLEGESFKSLSQIIYKPLEIPPFGRDSGHHGLDFTYFNREGQVSIEGKEIYAILPGNTVLTLADRIPYGYTILLETPLTDLPETIQQTMMANYLPVPENLVYTFNCPEVQNPVHTGDYSIYHLYAHFETHPTFNQGERVKCGAYLGTVGNTGRSDIPHLHLETRLGPSGASFQTMGHYDPSYSIKKLSNYCLWRASGHYQLFDPFLLFDAAR